MTEPWKIWYTDGSSYKSLDGPFSAAPKNNVLAVATYRTTSRGSARTLRYGGDFYVYDSVDQTVVIMDRFGVVQFAYDKGWITSVEPGPVTTYTTPLGTFDIDGLMIRMMQADRLLIGGWIPRSQYDALIAKIDADPEFPTDEGNTRSGTDFPPT